MNEYSHIIVLLKLVYISKQTKKNIPHNYQVNKKKHKLLLIATKDEFNFRLITRINMIT